MWESYWFLCLQMPNAQKIPKTNLPLFEDWNDSKIILQCSNSLSSSERINANGSPLEVHQNEENTTRMVLTSIVWKDLFDLLYYFKTLLRRFLTKRSVVHPQFGLRHYMQTPMIFINLYNKLWTMIISIDSMKSEILKRERILFILPHSKIEFKSWWNSFVPRRSVIRKK